MNAENSEIEYRRLSTDIDRSKNLLRAGKYSEAKAACPRYPSPAIGALYPDIKLALNQLLGDIQRAKAEAFIAHNTPQEFRHLDPQRFPSSSALHSLLSYDMFKPGYDDNGNPIPEPKQGLLLHGSTGSGKTRAAFHFLAKLSREETFEEFRYVSAIDLKSRFAEAARSGGISAVVADLLSNTDEIFLFIDDLGQARLTGSYAEGLFALWDRIYRDRINVVVTVQVTGAALSRKWCADEYSRGLGDTATAIIRRIKDSCHPIKFGA